MDKIQKYYDLLRPTVTSARLTLDPDSLPGDAQYSHYNSTVSPRHIVPGPVLPK